MIHSLSGGVISEIGYYTFAKVKFYDSLYGDRPYWYLCPFSEAEEGDEAIAPVGPRDSLCRCVILKVEKNVSSQCAPAPMNRIRELTELLSQRENG